MTPEPSNEYQKLVEAAVRAAAAEVRRCLTGDRRSDDEIRFWVNRTENEICAALSVLKPPHAWCRTCGKDWPKDENCDVCQQWWRENSPELKPPHAGDDGWQDIATAPKDGTPFLAYNPLVGVYNTAFTTRWTGDPDETGYEGFPCGFWHLGGSRSYPFGKWDCVPTHWRPLPTPPAGVSDD